MFIFLEQSACFSCFQMHICSPVCSCNGAVKLMLWASQVKAAPWCGSTTCTHLNPMSHSKDILDRSWLLYSCCLHFQLHTVNHLWWSGCIAGHGTERALLSLSDNPHYEHRSHPGPFFFNLSTAFDIANELWTVCKRGWLFWNSLFQQSHNQRGAVEKCTSDLFFFNLI